ncbi:hydroxyacid dehydrogenase [bacterium endosymbiont of Escarpia laminata]|nr:MAG: hydroxyacid dehydrogenase [bacterium endosymbiont of Escarpia laminata]
MKITVLGLGLMGQPIAERLQHCGHDVVAWNRSSDRLETAKEAGLEVEADLIKAMRVADVICLTLSDAPAIREVLLQRRVSAELAGKLVLQMGTVAPEESREIGAAVEAASGGYLEAPVLGSIPQARSGNLIVMAGGSDENYQRGLLLLRCLGKQVQHVGFLGQAAAMKLAMNQLIASLTAGFSLSLGLVRSEGIDVEVFMELLRESALYAPTFDKKLSKMLEHDYANPNFPLKHLIKDLALFQQVAEKSGIDAGLPKAMLRVFEKGRSNGHAEDDYSSLYEAINPEMDMGVDQGC